ncbi:MAG: hypothetical protein J0I99_00605 [Devosia sp.]|uniref:hypothetical protein n=1 Tax=Devosia sp. TaxID=1871048 RepID=UPI001AD536F3|nr:hypothetical protein [Devosia sp.]MBN9314217.1 hypothetical protein [Devosia sp.]
MPRYISRIYVIVDAENPDDAADTMSACLTENLMYAHAIVDWVHTTDPLGKSSTNNGFTYPVELTPPHAAIEDYREEDVDVIFQAARLVNR